MTLREFYADIEQRTKELSFDNMLEISDLSSLCYQLCRIQIPTEIRKEVSFDEEKELYQEVFCQFDPKRIVRRGQYLAQLNYVLETFLPKNISPYKKLTQTIFLTAKMLSKYKDLNEFIKEIQCRCPENDDKKMYEFLNNFRLTYSLPSMFFNTTCLFFSQSGLLDVPYLNQKIKNVLFSQLTLEEDNYSCFHVLCLLKKISDCCGYEISQRIEKVASL